MTGFGVHSPVIGDDPGERDVDPFRRLFEMPIYEYECCQCCEKFERLVFRSDEPVNCPQCDSENVQRVMSVCAFKSGGDKGAASSRMSTSASSSCSGCSGGSCSTCH